MHPGYQLLLFNLKIFGILDYNTEFPCGGEDWTCPFWNGKGNISKLFNNIYLYLSVHWIVMSAVYCLPTKKTVLMNGNKNYKFKKN